MAVVELRDRIVDNTLHYIVNVVLTEYRWVVEDLKRVGLDPVATVTSVGTAIVFSPYVYDYAESICVKFVSVGEIANCIDRVIKMRSLDAIIATLRRIVEKSQDVKPVSRYARWAP